MFTSFIFTKIKIKTDSLELKQKKSHFPYLTDQLGNLELDGNSTEGKYLQKSQFYVSLLLFFFWLLHKIANTTEEVAKAAPILLTVDTNLTTINY